MVDTVLQYLKSDELDWMISFNTYAPHIELVGCNSTINVTRFGIVVNYKWGGSAGSMQIVSFDDGKLWNSVSFEIEKVMSEKGDRPQNKSSTLTHEP